MVTEAMGGPLILVIGVGTEFRGDDAAGLLAVRRLRAEHVPPSVRFLESSNDGLNLIDSWNTADVVIVIDGVSANLAPGTVVTADIREGATTIPVLQSSTHHIGLVEAIELARVLGVLPPVLLLYGIQGKTFRPEEKMTREVAEAVDRVVRTVSADLRQWSDSSVADKHISDETLFASI